MWKWYNLELCKVCLGKNKLMKEDKGIINRTFNEKMFLHPVPVYLVSFFYLQYGKNIFTRTVVRGSCNGSELYLKPMLPQLVFAFVIFHDGSRSCNNTILLSHFCIP